MKSTDTTDLSGGKPHANDDNRPSPSFITDDALINPNDVKDQRVFVYPPEYENHLGSVLVPNERIIERTSQLAKIIKSEYEGIRPVFLCVLKGASIFFHALISRLQKERLCFTYEFIRAKSYEGSSSTGNVEISGMDLCRLRNKDVIIVEDIIDTGTTLSQLIPVLKTHGPKSVEVCTMLEKRLSKRRRETLDNLPLKAKYAGFSIPDKFVIGYGLDYDEWYRDLEDIWVISDYGIKNGGENNNKSDE